MGSMLLVYEKVTEKAMPGEGPGVPGIVPFGGAEVSIR